MTEAFYEDLKSKKDKRLKLLFSLFKDLVESDGIDKFINHFYLWDALAAMICLEPEIAVCEKIAIQLNLENAQTKSVVNKTFGANLVSVATEVKSP